MIPLLALCTLTFSFTAPVTVLAANLPHQYSALTFPYQNGVFTATENIREKFRQAVQVLTEQFSESDERDQKRKERRAAEDEKWVLPEELSSSRYGREAIHVGDSLQREEWKASSIQKRDIAEWKASSIQKRDIASECSGVGIRYDTTTPLYNCSGSLVPTSEFNDYYSDLACQQCVGGRSGAACERRCCRPAVIASSDAVLCRCPADYSGNQCQFSRQWSCNINYLSPGNLTCSSLSAPMETDVYGRDDCYKFSKKNESTVFLFNATCSQVDPLLDQGFEMSQFLYYVKTPKLALSKDPRISIMAKISNFHKISDLNQARQVYMSPDMYTGYQQYGFWYNLTELTLAGSPFFVGGRLYMEAVFTTLDASQPDFLDNEGTFRTYIDFYDIPGQDSSQTQNLGGLTSVGVTLVTVACFTVVAATAGFLHIRAKKTKED